MFAERKDAIEMALGIALLITCARFHTRTWRTWPGARFQHELALMLVTFVAVLLILLGTW